MLKTILLILLALAIAIGGGAASVWAVLEEAPALGAIRSGLWTAFPRLGSRDADPYTRARFARLGGIPLGQSEGIVFTATRDSGGSLLRRECVYNVEGSLPQARFWTFYAAAPSGAPLPPLARRRPALHSQMILLGADDGLAIAVSPFPTPGNWLATTGTGAMQLVLTLFDTPVSTGLQVAALELPAIRQIACDA